MITNFFGQKEVYRDSKRYIGIPLLVLWLQYSWFSFNVPQTGGKSTVYVSLAVFNDILFLPARGIPVTVNGNIGIPLGFVVASIADFLSMYRKLAENPPWKTILEFCLWTP